MAAQWLASGSPVQAGRLIWVETRMVAMVQSGLKGVLASVLALAVGAATSAAQAEIPGNLLRAAVLWALSGPLGSQAGPGSVAAAQLAAEDFAKEAGGLQVEIVSA